MTHRRILYGAVLAAALLFQICYRGWLGTFTLAVVIALPFFSLAVSLPGLLRTSLTLSPEASAVPRGQSAVFVLTLHAPAGLSAGRVTLRLTLENQLTGECSAAKRALRTGRLRERYPAPHCGQVVCTVSRVRICDLSGLFRFPLRPPDKASLLVLPLPTDAEIPPEALGGEHDGTGLRPRPGGGPGEDYDLRSYRPGDPLRAVHWKLSSKWDELVVREALEPRRAALILTFDHFGAPASLDETIDLLSAVSSRLLQDERPHRIQWADPESGAVQDYPVSDLREFRLCLAAALSTPAPESGRSILDASLRLPAGSAAVRHLHIAPPEAEGGKA